MIDPRRAELGVQDLREAVRKHGRGLADGPDPTYCTVPQPQAPLAPCIVPYIWILLYVVLQ